VAGQNCHSFKGEGNREVLIFWDIKDRTEFLEYERKIRYLTDLLE